MMIYLQVRERKAAKEAMRIAHAKTQAEEAELEAQYYKAGPQKLALLPPVGGAEGRLYSPIQHPN